MVTNDLRKIYGAEILQTVTSQQDTKKPLELTRGF